MPRLRASPSLRNWNWWKALLLRACFRRDVMSMVDCGPNASFCFFFSLRQVAYMSEVRRGTRKTVSEREKTSAIFDVRLCSRRDVLDSPS